MITEFLINDKVICSYNDLSNMEEITSTAGLLAYENNVNKITIRQENKILNLRIEE